MAAVLDAFVGGALKKLSALLEEKACMILGVVDDLKKLLRRLERLKIFLEDAESKSIQDPSIRSWLGELKDVIYDADDIIDICRIQGAKLLEGHQPFTSTHSVHLRYLNLNFTRIHELPDSIGKLINLQGLCLSNCGNLHFLPNGITELSNLRFLDVVCTPLVCLPKGFNQLKQLNRLKGFVVGDVDSLSKECQIEELQPLSKLRKLSIRKLERVRVTTGTSLLTDKQSLRKLKLSFSQLCEYGETEINAMEELCPPSNLEELRIDGYPGRRFPSWLPLYDGFSRLESVFLSNCESCTQLPPLGQLPQLKRLDIDSALSIVSVGPEFFFGGTTTGTGEGAFPKLEYLMFDEMPEWEELVLDYDECVHKGKLLPCLRKLRLDFCPKLRSLPSGLQHATSLQWLTINSVDCIQEVKNLPSLTELYIYSCRCLREIQHLPLLQMLHISGCPQLTRVSDVDSLQKLTLYLDEETEPLPHWLLELALKWQQRKANPDFEFQLYCSSIQLQRCREGGEDWHIIKQFPRVHITTEWFKYRK